MEKNKFEVIKKYSIKVDKKILDECKGKKGEKEVLRNRVLKRKLEKIFKENMVDMIGGREIEVKKIFKCDEDRVIWCELIEEIKKGDMREYKIEEILIIMELV